MRIIFMGTPEFSVVTLEALILAGHEVIGVVTQPDKPKGRGNSVVMTPVKEVALRHGIPVYQPKKVREEAFVEVLKTLKADVMVVIAFGQILPKVILEMPKYGCVNIHASLLPKYRGAAPIQYAVIDGEKTTGITTMRMNEGLDTGDMIDKVELALEDEETAGTLHDKLSKLGGTLIVETLKKLEDGTAVFTPQSEAGTCYAKPLSKDMGNIDWAMDAVEIERLIRGLNPWPSAYTSYEGRMLKLWKACVGNEEFVGNPGEIVRVEKNRIGVKAGNGILWILSLQLEGKKRMDTADFLRGYEMKLGAYLERSNQL